jgi:hypothetical protein
MFFVAKPLFGLVLPLFFLFFLNVLIEASKINDAQSSRLIQFTLFNYDNIIAGYYENESVYINELEYLLVDATGVPSSNIRQILLTDYFYNESNAVFFMLNLNNELKSNTGFYFVDN